MWPVRQRVPFSWEYSLPASTSDEFSLGPLWSPGVIEEVTVWSASTLGFTRLLVAALPLPQREAVGLVSAKGVEPVLVARMDGAVGFKQGLLANTTAGSGTFRLGRAVSFAPWWIWVVLDNRGAAVLAMAGSVVVELDERLALARWESGRPGYPAKDARRGLRVGMVRSVERGVS